MPTGQYQRRPRVERVQLKCEMCPNTITLLPSQLRVRKVVRFCSAHCMGESRKRPESKVTVPCDQCGRTFTKRADHQRERNYCSAGCAATGRRVDAAKWRDREQVKGHMRKYQKANRSKINAACARWRRTNRAKRLEIQKRYRDRNKEYLAAAARARRFGLKAGSFTPDEWEAMKALYGNRCLCCGVAGAKLGVDHIIPFKHGGQHHASNIQPLCRSCNASKGTKQTDYRPTPDILET